MLYNNNMKTSGGVKMKALAKIRRYDVFAATEFIKNLNNGIPEDVAKGDAIWLATLVAARKFSKGSTKPRTSNGKDKKYAEKNGIYTSKWRQLSGIDQTDKVYDKNIIQRMGEDFYEQVFLPKLKSLVEAGLSYKEYRDSAREELNYAKAA